MKWTLRALPYEHLSCLLQQFDGPNSLADQLLPQPPPFVGSKGGPDCTLLGTSCMIQANKEDTLRSFREVPGKESQCGGGAEEELLRFRKSMF